MYKPNVSLFQICIFLLCMNKFKGLNLFDFQTYVNENVSSSCNSRPGFSGHEEYDAFHVGPDARLHFTDTHLRIPKGQTNFCVEQLVSEHKRNHQQDQDYYYK